MKVIALLVSVGALTGCATKPDDRPVARRVCVTLAQETEDEAAYLTKKVASALKEYGFELAPDRCDVSVRYSRFGAFQGEAVRIQPFWISRSGYWSQEGMVTTIAADGKVLDEDRTVDLRGYSTKQALLDALAWSIAAPPSWYYRPASPLR